MKITGLLTLILAANLGFGQYYYYEYDGDTPGGLNQDGAYPEGSGQEPGWTEILGPSVATPTWSTSQSIPFAFDFNGAAVTSYVASSTGVLTFTASPGAAPSATNAALPDASIPDNSICVWGLEASGTNDHISTKTFGTAPNRQHWIHWSSCSNDAVSWSYWSIVLEETTNKIYIVDQRSSSGTGGLTVGLQISAAEAYQVNGSPNVDNIAGTDATSADDHYYEFNYGTLPSDEIALQEFDLLPYIGSGATDMVGTFVNLGANTITDVTVTWDDGTGPYVDNLSGLNVATNGTYTFTHGTQLNPTAGNAYTITLSVDVTGDINASNNDITLSTVSLTSIPNKVVVGEEKTGTWCGWCPRGAVALAGMESEPNFIGIAVHNGDPMVVSAYDSNIGTYVPGGYPGAGVDRVLEDDPSDFQVMFDDRVQDVTPCSVNDVNLIWNNNTNQFEVDCEVEFFGNIAGDYRLSMVLIEDNVLGDGGSGWFQTNYYDGDGPGAMTDPVTGFEWGTAGDPVDPNDFGGYDHVAIHLSNNDILGNSGSLPAGTVPAGVYTYSFSNVSTSVAEDPLDVHAVVMVVDANSGEILNAGKSSIDNVGIEENEVAFEMSVYPNPSSDNVNVSFHLQQTEQVSVMITNTLGQVVINTSETTRDAGMNTVTFNGDQLPNGVYMVHLKVGEQIITQKLIVQK